MTKRFLIPLATAAALAGSAGTAAADERIPEGVLSPDYIVHKLAADGTELRSIEFKRGRYVVDVATGQGRTYRAAVDASTGELDPNAFNTSGTDTAPAGSLSGSLIVQQVALAGYEQLIEMEMKNSLWKVKARDAAGRAVKLWVDPVLGTVDTRGDRLARN